MMARRLTSLFRGRGSTDEGGTFAANAEKARRQGQLERAVELCREGLKRAPEQLSARATLGRALMELGQYEEARTELEYVIRRAPDNLAAIRGLAELHDRSENAALLHVEHLGDWPPREADIALTIERAPDSVPAPVLQVEPVQVSEAIPQAAVELLEESEALEAIALEAITEEAPWVEPSTEPEFALDSEADVNLDAIASELAEPGGAAGPEASEPPAIALSLEADIVPEQPDGHAETDAAIVALERLLDKAKTRRADLTAGSAA